MRFNTLLNCEAAAEAFAYGAVLGYPTEGVWGIGCSAYDLGCQACLGRQAPGAE